MTEQEWFSAVDVAGLPDMPTTARRVRDRAERERWKFRERAGRGGGREYHIDSLPARAQVGLRTAAPLDEATQRAKRESLWRAYERKPTAAKDEAMQRLLIIDEVIATMDAGHSLIAATQTVAVRHAVSASTLRRWHADTRDLNRADWLPALIPGHTGRNKTAECSPEAWDYFRADFLRVERPAAAACYDRLQRVAAGRGWNVPSVKTLLRRIEREIARPARVLAREGRDALLRSYPAQQRERNVFHALEAVNADGHKFDVFARWPDGSIARPVLVGWQDLYSGKILSWRVDGTEHSGLVRLSYGDMVERYGVPSVAYMDNGRTFASKLISGGAVTRYRFKIREEDPTGILVQLGTEPRWTTPYHGQAKPIERAWRDLCEYVAKHPAFVGAYTGNKPTAKPENYRSAAVPLDQFLAVLAQEIAAHNARPGRRSAVCAGRSFDAAFDESYAASPIRKATAEQRALWLLAADGVTASRVDGSIALFGNRYWCEALGDYAGRKVIVRFDPDALKAGVIVYTLDGRKIGDAECSVAAGFDDQNAARDHARARTQYRRGAQTMLDAERRMSASRAATLLPNTQAPEPPATKVVQPIFGKRDANEIDVDETLRRAVAGWKPERI